MKTNALISVLIVGLGLTSFAQMARDVPPGGSDSFLPSVISTAHAAEVQSGDLIQLIASKDYLSTLVKALDAAGLTETLKGSGPYTIFAPSNTAFESLPAGTLSDLLKPENKAELKSLLLHHVIKDNVSSADLSDGTTITTGGGNKVRFTANGDKIKISDANVTGLDIKASNGMIHIIDTVIIPE